MIFFMKKNLLMWTVVLVFLCGVSLLLGNQQLLSNEITSIGIYDNYPGDSPDGFPSPGEKILLAITIVSNFIPTQSYIECDTTFITIENAQTKFFRYKKDTLKNLSFEPTISITKNCPTDSLIPFNLINKSDTVTDTLHFNLHIVGTFDSCYANKKILNTEDRVRIIAEVKTTKGKPTGYSSVVAKMKDKNGRPIKSVILFDDGNHNDSIKNDGLYSGTALLPSEQKDYVIDLQLSDSIANHSFVFLKQSGFTTKYFSLSYPYVIIDDPYSAGFENDYADSIGELFDSLNIKYRSWNVWFRGMPDSNEIVKWAEKKPIIVWATKLGGTLKHSRKEKKLVQYLLENGAGLLLPTANLGNYIMNYGNEYDSLFYKNLFCAQFKTRCTSSDSFQKLAIYDPLSKQLIDTCHLTLSFQDSSNFSSFYDIIKPLNPAIPIVYLYKKKDSTTIIDTSNCMGLAVKKDNYKLIYLSFGLDDIKPFKLRKTFFDKCLTWLSIDVQDTFSYKSPQEESTDIVKLLSPYPNPFLEKSTIPFAVTYSGEVKLVVCDLAGRIVKNLINSSLTQGNYYAVWDGKDEKGDEIAAGYYFVRLTLRTKERSTGKEIESIVSVKLLKLRK